MLWQHEACGETGLEKQGGSSTARRAPGPNPVCLRSPMVHDPEHLPTPEIPDDPDRPYTPDDPNQPGPIREPGESPDEPIDPDVPDDAPTREPPEIQMHGPDG